jgi:hypothetical protein
LLEFIGYNHGRAGSDLRFTGEHESRQTMDTDIDRAAAERALEMAQRNPVLSAAEACAVAQVHALLAIEARLAQLLAALVTASSRDQSACDPALAVFP